MYVLIFVSLLIHEAGHLLAAYLTGMRVRSCTIMPYGGELVIANRNLASKKERILVALGGPLATGVLLLIAMCIPFPGDEQVIRIQVALLLLNFSLFFRLTVDRHYVRYLKQKVQSIARAHFFYCILCLFLLAAIILLTSGLPRHGSLLFYLLYFS